MDVTNPATGLVIAQIPEDTPATTASKFEAAQAAQAGWAAVPLVDRIGRLRRFRDRLVGAKEDLARTLTAEVGKPIRQSWAELDAMPDRIGFSSRTSGESWKSRRSTPIPRRAWEERVAYEPSVCWRKSRLGTTRTS